MERKAYRQSRKLAKELGCRIGFERVADADTAATGGWYNNYYVTGPADPYQKVPPRRDPLEGNHYCCDWEEVYNALLVYRLDLHFHHFGIGTEDGERIRDFADESLLEEWRADPADLDTAGVLADRLEDEGHEHESGVLRAAVKRMGQMRLDNTNALPQGDC